MQHGHHAPQAARLPRNRLRLRQQERDPKGARSWRVILAHHIRQPVQTGLHD